MANKWRPQGWQNPYIIKARQMGMPITSFRAAEASTIYEAGADAILKSFRTIEEPYEVGGKWVFIPDEEV